MDPETRDLLARLNRTFYERHAGAFSETRAAPWPGIDRALERLSLPTPVRVLDLGCGNGRILPALARRYGSGLRYHGVDASERLLALAREQHAGVADASFSTLDFVCDEPGTVLPPGPFDLVILLAVLHHVPSEARRRALVHAAASRLSKDGYLILTLWRFDSDSRFAGRRIEPSALHELDPSLELDPDELEPGDTFLRFGSDPSAVRYCHFPSAAETARLLADLELLERFDADGKGGRLNEYLVLRAPTCTLAESGPR